MNEAQKYEEKPKLLVTADALFKSGLFPNVKNVFGAFSIVQYGAELGIGPMTSLQSMAIVQGKIAMSAGMMLALAVKGGVTYQVVVSTNEKAEIKFKGDCEYTSTFSIEDAKRAGIYKEQSGWTKYPKDMCFHRAVTAGIRRVKPGIVLGLYAIEELQDAPPLDSPPKTQGTEGQDAPESTISPDPLPEHGPETTSNFEWLKKMSSAKKGLGQEAYYGILGDHGFEHANQVLDAEMQDKLLADMRAAYKEKK